MHLKFMQKMLIYKQSAHLILLSNKILNVNEHRIPKFILSPYTRLS